MIDDVTRPTVVAGQRSGEIRSDVDPEAIVAYIVEQSDLTTRTADRSAQAIWWRFRNFIEAALVPAAGVRVRNF